MFMPADLTWLEPVVVMTAVVFVVGLIGNILSFSSRFMNALVTALVFALLSGALFFMMFKDSIPRTIAAPSDLAWLEPVIVMSAIVFVVDLVGNMLSFSNRFMNAIVTAVVFAMISGASFFYLYKDGAVPAVPVPAATAAPETAPAAPAPTPATP